MRNYLFCLSLVLLFAGCKDTVTYPCSDIREGVLNFDLEQAKPGIDQMLEDLAPVPDSTDNIGHEDNLDIFIDRLTSECDFDATIECYGCIETFPVLSHVLIGLDSSGIQIQRALDILTPATGVMTLKNIHQ